MTMNVATTTVTKITADQPGSRPLHLIHRLPRRGPMSSYESGRPPQAPVFAVALYEPCGDEHLPCLKGHSKRFDQRVRPLAAAVCQAREARAHARI